MSFSRRLLIYIILFITLNVYAFGFFGLTQWILDLIGIIGDFRTQTIAPFLSAIIVCFPIWLFVWRYVNKGLADSPSEEASTMRNLYLNLVIGLSTIFISISIFELVESIIELESPLSAMPWLIVWTPLFYIHLRHAQKDWAGDSRKRVHEFYLNLTFIISLIIIFISSQSLVLDILDYLLLLIFSNDVLINSPNNLNIEAGQISALITATGLWFYSWNLRIKRLDFNFRTIDLSVITISQAFIFLLSIFFILAQAIMLIFEIGSEQTQSLYKTLEFLPQILSFSIVSIFIWLYYSSAFLNTGVRKFYNIKSTLIKWTYRYSVRAIALILLISSSISVLIFLIGIPIELSEEVLIASEREWEFHYLSASISALLIGFVTLRYINNKIESDSEVSRKNDIERSYIYIVGVFFLFFLIGSLIAILTMIITALITLSWSSSTIELIRFPFSFALNAILILWFYRKDIISRFKADPEKKISVEILSSTSLLEHKAEFHRLFNVKSFQVANKIRKLKFNKESINKIDSYLKKHEAKKYYIVEEGQDIILYYAKD